MIQKKRTNPISELTRTWGMGDLYWVFVVVLAMLAVFVLFFLLVIWIALS